MNDSLSTLYVIFLFNIKLVVLTPPYYSKEKNSPCLQPITYDAIKNDFECIWSSWYTWSLIKIYVS
jgi:hypothetical protein